MESRYNVYFAGQLLEGHELSVVRGNIARLFNADQATLEKLFSGKAQLIKRDCDRETALKYKAAIERAGALPVIRAATAQATGKPEQTPGGALSAAEKIAALAAAPDLGSQPVAAAHPDPEPVSPPADASTGKIELSPAGTAVLEPEERAQPVAAEVNTPDLQVDASGERLSPVPPAPPPPPDTSHLSEAAVGERLPNLPSAAVPVSPDTSAIELAPEGTDFSDCGRPEPAALDLDLSGIDIAPAGADVLEQQYRKKDAPPPPATDHLALEE